MVTLPSEHSGTDPGPRPMPLAFETFVRENSRTWLRYARTRLKSLADAEDVVQEAALRLHHQWAFILELPEPRAMQAFALRVVKGKTTEALRSRVRDGAKFDRIVQLGEAVSEENARGRGGDEMLDQEGVALRMAMEALGRTNPLLAEAVRLRMLKLTYREIGEALGIASTTAKTWASEGWRWLNHMLNHEDETESS